MVFVFPLRAAFFAIPLEGEARAAFRALQGALSEYTEILSFQSPETPHITLQFWRELMEIEYGQVVPQCVKIAAATEPFALKVEGVGTFSDRGRDRVLYLGIPFSDELARLKKRCPWPSATPEGEKADGFRPHLTLARIKHPERFAVAKKKVLRLLGHPSFAIPVDRIRLYAEVGGKKQTLIAEFPLG